MLEINSTMLLKQRRALEAALSTSAEAEKILRKLIKEELKAARDRMRADVPFKHGDPRGAKHSIRYSVYKRVLGGNVNILRSSKAGAPTSYIKPRKLDSDPHQRGGNRRKVSENTKRIDSYGPTDRGFILNFLNSGTDERVTKYGNRKLISPRDWFTASAQKNLEIALSNLDSMIDDELNRMVAEKMN